MHVTKVCLHNIAEYDILTFHALYICHLKQLPSCDIDREEIVYYGYIHFAVE